MRHLPVSPRSSSEKDAAKVDASAFESDRRLCLVYVPVSLKAGQQDSSPSAGECSVALSPDTTIPMVELDSSSSEKDT